MCESISVLIIQVYVFVADVFIALQQHEPESAETARKPQWVLR